MAEFVRNIGVEQNVNKEAPITPDFLPNDDRLAYLYDQTLRTQNGYNLLHPKNKDLIPPSMRGTKATISNIPEKVIAVHKILRDPNFENPDKEEVEEDVRAKFANSKYGVIGTALHQLSDLMGLINTGKLDKKSIYKAFPTHKEKALKPFFDVLKSSDGQSLYDVWDRFRRHKELAGLFDEEEAWILKEFPDIPLSEELQEELKTRRGKEVYKAGCLLIPHIMNEVHIDGSELFFEAAAIKNWKMLSLDGNTRVQILNRSDWAYSYLDENGKLQIKFFDLKTGKIKDDYAHKLQALIMYFDDGHTIDSVMKNGRFPRRKEEKEGKEKKSLWYTPQTIDYIAPWNRDYTLDYLQFDIKTGKITRIPVEISYGEKSGRKFLKTLAFYSDAFVAFKKEIEYYLRTGEVPDVFPKRIYTQNELPLYPRTIDLSNIPPAREKPEKKIEQYFRIGNTVDSKDFVCPHCGSPATETYIKEVKSRFKGVNNSFLYVRYACKANENHTNYLEDNRKVVSSAAILPAE